eukprot:TRINITY_DN1149_c0_g1_i1.p1 TRINITY_DN1149_c0_g1~~TRINITY_DN1149_c0_g1_i1.p1  ORF type:complete len:442 (+),score=62.04 TRINITY_DN1149_c0_g1_i1:103-1428(+)
MGQNKSGMEGLVKIWGGYITLNEGTTMLHFIGKLILCFVGAFAQAVVEVLFILLLSAPDEYKLGKKTIGSISGNLILMDLIFRILSAGIAGPLYDKLGRRKMLSIGISITSIGTFLLPFMPNIFLLGVARIVFGCGVTVTGLAPLIADYIQDTDKGKSIGVATTVGSLGGVAAVGLVNILLLYHRPLHEILVIASFVDVLVGGVGVILVRNGLYFLKEDKKPEEGGIIAGFKLSRHPWLLLGYVVSFVSCGQTFLSASSLVMWTKIHYVSEIDGGRQATKLMGIAFSMVFIFGALMGYVTDRISLFVNTFVTFFLSVLAMMATVHINNPEHIITYASMVIWGLSLAGQASLSTYLIDRFAPEEHRGKAHAVQGITSIAGILACSNLGGYLFDRYIHSPFIIFIIATIVTLILLLFIYLTRSSWLYHHEKPDAPLTVELTSS